MQDSKSKKISIFIFLFALFVMLALLTGGYLYKLYIENIEFTDKETNELVNCDNFYFNLVKNTISYNENKLTFEVKNSMGKEINQLIIESNNKTTEKNMSLAQGDLLFVVVNLEVNNNFSVYPKGCKSVQKTFTIE